MALREYTQPTSLPVPKVQAVGIAGVIVTAIVAILAAFGVIVPDGVSESAVGAVAALVTLISLLQTVITFVAGYFKKDAKPTEVIQAIQENKSAYRG